MYGLPIWRRNHPSSTPLHHSCLGRSRDAFSYESGQFPHRRYESFFQTVDVVGCVYCRQRSCHGVWDPSCLLLAQPAYLTEVCHIQNIDLTSRLTARLKTMTHGYMKAILKFLGARTRSFDGKVIPHPWKYGVSSGQKLEKYFRFPEYHWNQCFRGPTENRRLAVWPFWGGRPKQNRIFGSANPLGF